MTDRRTERWFAAVAVVLLVASVGAVVADPGGEASGSPEVAFDAPVPAEYDFGLSAVGERGDGYAAIDGERYDTLAAAVGAAEPGDTVAVHGHVAGPVSVETPNVTIAGESPSQSVVSGEAEGDIVTVNASGVTVRDVWVRNAGYSTADNDAAVWVAAPDATLADARVTNTTFGVWVDGVPDATVRNTTIVGRESIDRLSNRGNGVQLWRANDAELADNRITDVRDGVYFSWSSGVVASNNTMWNLRYGVHYMYSDRNRLANNTAFGNDVGYALMVSDDLEIVDNVAVNNSGTSGHGVLVKEVDHSTIAGNDFVGNDNGIFVYNSLDDAFRDNLVLANDVGVHLTAGSVDMDASGNSFVDNADAMYAVVGEQVAWNASDRGNYWSDASPVDVDHDGVSEVRFQPDGTVENLAREHPETRVFASSPAFDAVRLAGRSVPLVDAPGVVDHHPLATPAHDNWRRYYE
ncbi:ABC-type transport system periplasmic substrate-binding protein (probable substrate copper) [Halobacterium hubeiense]|uniref:Nitrous oxide reductase family maturation protein NosD n=2 Tax=Halobacterium TaxID=2239 RepID=A0AAU8CGG9_9EURY|nr:nitrous oxide reductase family maturation protein NosD [Halobacterium hubeiense]CQH44286.1 ABC-type transport system periplasmic substrate-binding protein (probable substrate copper) [Halobacterium hubeiense]